MRVALSPAVVEVVFLLGRLRERDPAAFLRALRMIAKALRKQTLR